MLRIFLNFNKRLPLPRTSITESDRKHTDQVYKPKIFFLERTLVTNIRVHDYYPISCNDQNRTSPRTYYFYANDNNRGT